ncbi:hypothetical protein [Streptomyces yangpuensis]|uniref:hypothetical protein n=1 Tax=Streptomyces yangpuensis TaxID=1648182 RepID=UPI00380C2AEB
MSRTARLAAVAAAFAALCAAAVTVTPGTEGHRISAATAVAAAGINGGTPPADADGSINWD